MASGGGKRKAATSTDSRFWPYSPRVALLAVAILLLSLGLATALLKAVSGWPPPASTNLVLTGVFVLSLLPLLLAVLDRVAERGGGLELPFVKMNFAAVLVPLQPVTIAPNIGVAGTPINDSTSQQILDTLRTAVNSDIVVLDLETGAAWWETRLVVLCAGAVRLGHPQVIVFLATQAERTRLFQGWARPDALLAVLLTLRVEYRTAILQARLAAAQWAVVATPGQMPPSPMSPLADEGKNVAPFIHGEVNDLATEQFLALALGKLETPPVLVSTLQLKGAYSAGIHTNMIDQSLPAEEQTKQFLLWEVPYTAITDRGRYLGLLPRGVGQNSILRALVERNRTGTTSETGFGSQSQARR